MQDIDERLVKYWDVRYIGAFRMLYCRNPFPIQYNCIEIFDKNMGCWDTRYTRNKFIPPCERTFFKYRHESMTNIILFGLMTNKAQKGLQL